MHITGVPSQQFESSFKCFANFLVDLHKLPTFDAVSQAEEAAHERIGGGHEAMNSTETQIVMLMQQITELYARDRQMQITGRNPFEVLVERDEAAVKNGCSF